MNKNAIIITVVIILLAVAGIFMYDRYFNQPDKSLWDMVPQNTALIYEPQAGMSSWENATRSNWWNTLSELESLKDLEILVNELDTLLGRELFDEIISDGKLLIGINPVSGSKIDFLFLLDNQNKKGLTRIIENYVTTDDYKISSRVYNDYNITEIKKKNSDKIFSYSTEDNYWFGSFSPFLVEDVIRQRTEESLQSFKGTNPEPFFTSRIRNDAGNFFFNYGAVTSLVNTFLAPASREVGNDISNFGKSAFFDVSFSENVLLMNGFSFISDNTQFLSKLRNHQPERSQLQQYIPSHTAICINTLYESELHSNDSLNLNGLRETLNGEYAVAILEDESTNDANKLYYLGSNNIGASIDWLKELAKTIKNSSGDTLYYESFSDKQIIELQMKGFPAHFSEFTFGEYDDYYFTEAGNYLVFSNTIEALKSFLIDLETENTWGKSVQKNNFLSKTIEESNLNFYVDLNRSWNFWLDKVHPSWKEHFESNANLYRKMDLICMQFSYTDDKVYANIIASHNPDNTNLFERRRKIDPDIETLMGAAIQAKPKVVRNHRNRNLEVIVQDANNALSLVGFDGKILWTDTLPGTIASEIHQIDYFKNSFLQYVFAVDSSIYLYDRNGNIVDGFPIPLPFKADHFNVIDYDNSKNYRFILSDNRGNIYMYNKHGENLEGWQPLKTEGKLARPPMHLRIRGRDCIMALQEKGQFLLFNRRGERIPGFPVDLGPYVQKDFAIFRGANFESTILTFVTEEGLISHINLNGESVRKEQMVGTSANSKFHIVPETMGNGHVRVMKDIGGFALYDEKGNEIFKKILISPTPFEYQYYDFGSNRKLFVVTDPEQEYSYLYDQNGQLLNNSPINSKFEIGVLFSEKNNQYRIYSAYESNLNVYVF